MEVASITTTLAPLAILACPVGMGAMMWMMTRSGKRQPPGVDARPPDVGQPASLEVLREEHDRLGAEIDRFGLKELWLPERIWLVMAGRSRYQIVLSEEERVELEHRAACYSRPHREVQRAKLVLYAAEGMSNVEIGPGWR